MAATETFANTPQTVVTAGGTTAPAPGTVETWTVAAPSAFPAAATGSTQFHVADPALPSELIAVTNASGATWTVTRGAESTTPVAHAPAGGFAVRQVASAGWLSSVVAPASGTQQAGALPVATSATKETWTTRVAAGSQTAVVTGQEGLSVGAPAVSTANIFVITDDPANPRTVDAAQMLYIADKNNAPIFGIGPSGGPKTFGDYMGVWYSTAAMAAQFTPFGAAQVGGSAGPRVFGGTGAPLPALTVTLLGSFSALASAGDMYVQADAPANPLWFATAGGGTAARGGTWAQAYLPLAGGNLTGNLGVAGNVTATFGNFDASLAGTGFRAAEGANAKQGTVALTAGGVGTVANTSVTATSRIFLTSQADGGTPGFLRVSARTPATSFIIKSSSATDTSVIAYEIFEQG